MWPKDITFAPPIWEQRNRNVFWVKKWKNLTMSFDKLHYMTEFFLPWKFMISRLLLKSANQPHRQEKHDV